MTKTIEHHVVTKPGSSYWSEAEDLGIDFQKLGMANSWADLHPGTVLHLPPVNNEPPMMIGASVARRDGLDWADSLEVFEEQVGIELDVVRRFTGDDGSRGFGGYPQFLHTHNRYNRIVSVKGWPTVAEFDRFLSTFPFDTYRSWLCNQHEPDQKKKNLNPLDVQTQYRRLHRAWDDRGRPGDITPTAIVMSYLERDGDDGTSSADWFPEPDIIGDFTLFIDPYDPGARRELVDLSMPTIELWRNAGGGPWGIAETGTKRTGADGARWITEGAAAVQDEGCISFCYFHSSEGEVGDWWLDDPAMREAFGALKGGR